MTNRELMIEASILCVVMLTATLLWFKYYIQPRDAFLTDVMDCMTTIENHTEYGYNICSERVREARM